MSEKLSYRFEWDDDKARSNETKHGISFDEAVTVFHDALSRIFDDEVHSIDEKREIILGQSIRDRLLLVCLLSNPKRLFALSALVCRRRKNVRIMKKPSTAKARSNKSEDMLPEYDFDYRKARPNRFAGRISKERVVVLLDREVSEVFTTPESVNTVLRALITAMPEGPKRASRK